MTSDPELNPDEIQTNTDRAQLTDASLAPSKKEAFDMSDVLNPNSMLEAVRLTRAARLAEATTLIQRMLRGETAPDMALGAANEFAPTGREPPIIDAKAETIDETGGPLLNAANPRSRSFARCAVRSIVPSAASGSDYRT